MRWLGTISYSTYMVHSAVGFALTHAVNSLLPQTLPVPVQLCLAVFNVAAAIGLASVTFLWIEAPIRAWSRGSNYGR